MFWILFSMFWENEALMSIFFGNFFLLKKPLVYFLFGFLVIFLPSFSMPDPLILHSVFPRYSLHPSIHV